MSEALVLNATRAAGKITRVTAVNSRPLAASMLIGRSPEEALAIVPNLFARCSRAQTLAARLACEVAAGVLPLQRPFEEQLLAIEMAQEHLWRLLLDWPPLLGLPPQRAHYANVHRGLNRSGHAEIFTLHADSIEELADPEQGESSPASMLERLLELDASPAACAPRLLPEFDAEIWTRQTAEIDGPFCAAPIFDGAPAETGPLARHHAQPEVQRHLAAGRHIVARFMSKLIDLAECTQRLRTPGLLPPLAGVAEPAPSVGMASVNTARGMLLHQVRLEDGKIADYSICAPTEWNFHPQGVFVQESTGLPASDPDTAHKRLAALALALDPCVAYQLDLRDEDAPAHA
ncbi:hydrogenase assembly protein HupF [Betaproteobacteria bacterium]|nr:hydrogenase assembly protein HupF [Betaproteobacteria bacterium]GHU17025.1 hydrogenase assembly protein HupF [Betaproteobacteria bacterium]